MDTGAESINFYTNENHSYYVIVRTEITRNFLFKNKEELSDTLPRSHR